MKLSNLSLLAAALLSAAPLVAENLQSATNQQLVDEVARRLSVAPVATTAVASYSCDSSATLHMTVFPSTGDAIEKTVYVGDGANCAAQAAVLNANRTQISALVLAAACDSSGTLHRYPINATGTFGNDSSVYVGDVTSCMAQAKAINSGN